MCIQWISYSKNSIPCNALLSFKRILCHLFIFLFIFDLIRCVIRLIHFESFNRWNSVLRVTKQLKTYSKIQRQIEITEPISTAKTTKNPTEVNVLNTCTHTHTQIIFYIATIIIVYVECIYRLRCYIYFSRFVVIYFIFKFVL